MVETLNWASATRSADGQLANSSGVRHNTGQIAVTASLPSGSATTATITPANTLKFHQKSGSGSSKRISAGFSFTAESAGFADGAEKLDFWLSRIVQGNSGKRSSLFIKAFDLDKNQMPAASAITFLGVPSHLEANPETGSISVVPNISETQNSAVHVSISSPISRLEIEMNSADGAVQSFEVSDLIYSPALVPSCFGVGTRIATENGETPVEDLREGDLVVTLGHGLLPIRWVGQQTVQAAGAFAPICLTKGALGNTRDLILSPAHRLVISDARVSALFSLDEVLVPAKALVDEDRIYRKSGGEVTYFHILLDRHVILLAEGTATESLMLNRKTVSGFSKEAQNQVHALFPELSTRPGFRFSVARPVLNLAETKLLLS